MPQWDALNAEFASREPAPTLLASSGVSDAPSTVLIDGSLYVQCCIAIAKARGEKP
jgi:hypothetical protein